MHRALDSIIKVGMHSTRWLARLRNQLINDEFEFEQEKLRPGLKENMYKVGIPMYDEAVLTAIEIALIPYFEKKFLPNSHGWRPNRRLETCLYQIQTDNHQADWMWSATTQEGFTELPWELVIWCLRNHVHDPAYLELVEKAHKIGFGIPRLYSPTDPQAQPVSMPLIRYLYNVVFHEFDLAIFRLSYRPKWRDSINGKNKRHFKYYRYANEILFTYQGSEDSNKALQKAVKNRIRKTLGLTLKINEPTPNNSYTDAVRFVTFDLALLKDPAGQKTLHILIPIKDLDKYLHPKWAKRICGLNPFKEIELKQEPILEDLIWPPKVAPAKLVYRPHQVWDALWDHYSIATNAHVIEPVWIYLKQLAYREIKPGKIRRTTLLNNIYKPLKKLNRRGGFTEILPLPKGGFKPRPCRPTAEENFPTLIGLTYDIGLGPKRGFLPKKTPKQPRKIILPEPLFPTYDDYRDLDWN